MKILVVEDETLIQKAIQRMLEKKGAEVIACSNGADAIRFIQDNQFDRIVCDLMLGDISGIDVIEEYKRLYGIKAVQENIVIITAYSSQNIIEKVKTYGCPIVGKPFVNISEAIELFLRK